MPDETFIESYKQDFINRLRNFRNERDISAREMSLSLGQNVNYINLIENGKRLPSMQGFFLICEYLKIAPQEFFKITEDRSTYEDSNDKDTEQDNLGELLSDIKNLGEKELPIVSKMIHALV